METSPQSHERTGGLPTHLASLLASVAAYLRARFELAGLEGKDAAGYGLKAVVCLAAALGFIAFGYTFLWIGLIALIALAIQLPWGWIVLGVGMLHLAGAALFVAIAAAQWKKPFFQATLEEFRKDQEWLKRHS